jgi:hypothetical protein
MGPTPIPALRRVLVLVVVVTSLLVGCAPSPAVSSPAPPAVSSPALPAVSSPALPAVSSPALPAVRFAAAAAVAVGRPVGTAGARLTVTVTGSTVVDETWSGWSEGAWSHRGAAVVDGVSSTVGELVVVDGLLHARIGDDTWRTAPVVPGVHDAVRDPGEVLALLRRAGEVAEGPAADVLVVTVPHVALTGAEGESARFEVRLTDRASGTEAVAEVRGTIPPLGPGGVAVDVEAWWSAEPPPPIVAPRIDRAAPPG